MSPINVNVKQLPVVLSVTVIFVTLWVGVNLIVKPAQARRKLAQAALAEERQKSELVRQIQAQLDRMEAWQHRLLSGGQTTEWLVGEATRLANEAGVRVSSINPQAVTRFEGAAKFAVSLEVESGYHNLGQFLGAIESASQIIQVERLQMTGAGSATALPRVELVLSSWYVAPAVGGQP